ncbi:MAG: M14 family zinc carboxypeptidase [Rhodothermaceae bacterium]
MKIKSQFILVIILTLLVSTQLFSQSDLSKINLKYEKNITLTYNEIIDAYKILDSNFDKAKLIEVGKTDIGKPLHLFIISGDSDFDPESVKRKNRTVVFINNGIHPGEPCGMDASIQFAMDLLTDKNNKLALLENLVFCIVPIYSPGGTLNRSAFNRANQDTPYEAGFRGNGRNLDLNRDFVKLDTKNARSLVKAFRTWEPQVFLDTHTTNGSDHQYVITLIAQNPASMHPAAGKYFKNKMVPDLYRRMAKGKYEMIPYIASIGKTPYEKGFINYIPSPRFSTGYTNLFNNFCFMTENHIFKEYKDRVKSVYNFITALAEYSSENSSEINSVIARVNEEIKTQKEFILNWKLDKEKFSLINFKGYRGKYKKSMLTGLDRFYYDHNDKFEEKIKYYTEYNPSKKITAPKKYIIPQAWSEAIERLKLNNIEFEILEQDSIIECEVYYITDLKSYSRPHNGHFFHTKVTTRKEIQKIQYFKGDMIVAVNQKSNRYIVNVLEPEAPDSFFRWNFFDACLDQREYFSTYVFEEKAIKLLEEIPGLREKFEVKQKSNEKFRKNQRAQLDFIYKNSPYYEKTHKRYPVARILH